MCDRSLRAGGHVMARGKFVMFGSHAPHANLEIEEAASLQRRELLTTTARFSSFGPS